MTVCVIQYDSRPDSKLRQQKDLTRINKRTCESDKASYFFHRFPDTDLPPYWQKVKLADAALQSGQCSEVIYLDTDAVLLKKPSELVSMMKNKSFLMSQDMPPWKSQFNAGVWVVRNDTDGRRLMREWRQSYDPVAWSRQGRQWGCVEHKCDGRGVCTTGGCEWAGRQYEQGAFLQIFARNKPHIEVVKWDALQHHCSPGTEYTGAMACHFASDYKQHINHFLETSRH